MKAMNDDWKTTVSLNPTYKAPKSAKSITFSLSVEKNHYNIYLMIIHYDN